MKTMEINELVSELKEYDGELPVKVWSGGAEKPYPISNVATGTMCAYIGINDRNLVDLSKIWHDASEEPTKKGYLLIQFGNDEYGTFKFRDIDVWRAWLMKNCYIIRWAYISDLLPKGGEK